MEQILIQIKKENLFNYQIQKLNYYKDLLHKKLRKLRKSKALYQESVDS